MMIKRLLLTLLILFCAVNAYSADYWVYIRTYDRAGVTKSDDAGRSKKGDIVDIRIADYSISESEKKEWLIIETSDLPADDITKYKEQWETKDGDIVTPIAYRKNKIDIKNLGLQEKPGVGTEKVSATTIKNNVTIKTSADLSRYEINRLCYLVFQRPVYKLARFILPYAWASTVVSKINMATQDYDTLTLWEDAKDGDLVTATTIQEADCYDDDGTLSDAFTVDGSTTNSSYYMYVTSPIGERHNGTAASGFCIDNSAGTSSTITLADKYSVVEWLIVTGWESQWDNSTNYGIVANLDGDNEPLYATIRNNIVHDDGEATISGPTMNGIGGYGGNYIYNNIVYDVDDSGIKSIAGYKGNAIYYNNTVYNYNNGNEDTGGGIVTTANASDVVKNNLVIQGANGAGAGCYVWAGTPTTATNGGSDTTGDIDNLTTAEFTSVAGGSEDLHLATGATSIDVGTDLGTGSFSFDIDNRDRDALGDTWDIGADEYVVAGGVRRIIFIE